MCENQQKHLSNLYFQMLMGNLLLILCMFLGFFFTLCLFLTSVPLQVALLALCRLGVDILFSRWRSCSLVGGAGIE